MCTPLDMMEECFEIVCSYGLEGVSLLSLFSELKSSLDRSHIILDEHVKSLLWTEMRESRDFTFEVRQELKTLYSASTEHNALCYNIYSAPHLIHCCLTHASSYSFQANQRPRERSYR